MLIAVIRTIILYLLIILGIRLLGKRQIGELEPSELVLSLIIADLAAVPMQDFGIPLLMGIIPILTLLCLSAILSVLTEKNIRFRALLCSRPSIVIQDGKVLPKEMEKNHFTIDELMEELRMAGVTDLATGKDLGLKRQEKGLPLIIISDGHILTHNLTARNLSQGWLEDQLHSRGIQSVEQIYLMTVDEMEGVYLIQKEAKV